MRRRIGVDSEWKDAEYSGNKQGQDHPVVSVSWEDAQAFCKWLSKKEGKTHRLPTDHEWSLAVGIVRRGPPAAIRLASPETMDSAMRRRSASRTSLGRVSWLAARP